MLVSFASCFYYVLALDFCFLSIMCISGVLGAVWLLGKGETKMKKKTLKNGSVF